MLSLRPDTLALIAHEVGQQILSSAFERVLMLNGHVTNSAPLSYALETIRAELPEMRIAIVSVEELPNDVHARCHNHFDYNWHANNAETSTLSARTESECDILCAISILHMKHFNRLQSVRLHIA